MGVRVGTLVQVEDVLDLICGRHLRQPERGEAGLQLSALRALELFGDELHTYCDGLHATVHHPRSRRKLLELRGRREHVRRDDPLSVDLVDEMKAVHAFERLVEVEPQLIVRLSEESHRIVVKAKEHVETVLFDPPGRLGVAAARELPARRPPGLDDKDVVLLRAVGRLRERCGRGESGDAATKDRDALPLRGRLRDHVVISFADVVVQGLIKFRACCRACRPQPNRACIEAFAQNAGDRRNARVGVGRWRCVPRGRACVPVEREARGARGMSRGLNFWYPANALLASRDDLAAEGKWLAISRPSSVTSWPHLTWVQIPVYLHTAACSVSRNT